MPVYEVSYDLRQPHRNYEDLHTAHRRYDHCHPLESVWLLDTAQDRVQIRDHLQRYMDGDDGILVTRLHGEWAADGLSGNSANG